MEDNTKACNQNVSQAQIYHGRSTRPGMFTGVHRLVCYLEKINETRSTCVIWFEEPIVFSRPRWLLDIVWENSLNPCESYVNQAKTLRRVTLVGRIHSRMRKLGETSWHFDQKSSTKITGKSDARNPVCLFATLRFCSLWHDLDIGCSWSASINISRL